jgi:hypothetical protein
MAHIDGAAAYRRALARDIADEFMSSALGDPDKVTYRRQNHTFTYCRIAYLVGKRSGKVVGETYPGSWSRE